MGQKQAYWLLALCLPALLLFQQFAGEAGGALAPHHSLAHVQDESVANQFLPLMNVPAATPTLTPTPTFTPTSPPTSSATPTPTSTATATETVPASSSATPTATSTATNTPTTTASSTATNTPTATSTGTATATTTGTATATATNTPTATSTGTATATATNTPTATATGTATATATNTPTATASPTPGGPPTPGPAVLVGAGDMVECGEEGHEATADLLDDIPGTVFTTGDNIQAGGATLENFENCYEPSWGRHKARTNPAIGNHDYDDAPDAEGYFAYFGDGFGEPGQGYYSYDRGDWHIIVLNSNCGEVDGGCGPSSPQVQWLEQELADNPNACTLAYFHHPRFRAINNNEENGVTIFWQRLYDAGADVILSSHDHIYARFPLVDPDGNPDPVIGIRMFTVGTGGTGLDNNQRTEAPVPDSWIRAWGVLKLELYATSYDWEFIPVPGQSGAESDSGSGVCHGPPGG